MPKANIYVLDKPKRAIATVDADILGKYLGGSRSRIIRGGNPVVENHLKNEETLEAWMYVKPMHQIPHEAFDPLWTSTLQGPCLSKAMSKNDSPKCGAKSIKMILDKNNPNAPPKPVTGQTLRWNRSWLLIFDIDECRDEDPAFYQLVRDSFLPTFIYHCQGKDNSGVLESYIRDQFENNTTLAMLISDCVDVPENTSRSEAMSAPKSKSMTKRKRTASTVFQPQATATGHQMTLRNIRQKMQTGGDTDCSYIIMGFMFMDYDHKQPSMVKWAHDRMIYQPQRPRTVHKLYIDIICSRLGMGTIMMREILAGGNSPWMEIVFGQRNVPFMAFLRAIPGVYTYYPFVFDYVRTFDNVSFAPIFEVDLAQIRRSRLQIPNVDKNKNANENDLMIGMFGPPVNGDGFPVWQKSKMADEDDIYYVYKLERASKDFFNLNKLVDKYARRVKFFSEMETFEDDSDSNGYIYGKYIMAK